MHALALTALVGLLVPQTPASLEARLAEVTGEDVAFHFAVDDDVSVCEHGFRRGDDGGSWYGRTSSDGPLCPGGPLEIVLRREGSRIDELDMGPVGSRRHDADLGEVDPVEAAEWLLSLRDRDASSDAVEEALAGAVVARGATPAPALLDMARDRELESDLRQSALFWVSQVAARGIDTTLVGIAGAEAEDQEVRDAAVFALSQRPVGEAVPALMELARTAPHTQTRRSALFWLSQADDERVPDFFAELILGTGG